MAFEPYCTAAAPSEIKEEKDCDVVVVGYGLARSAAAKAAAEEGAKVIVIEKQPESSYSVVSMAGDFGVGGLHNSRRTWASNGLRKPTSSTS